MQTRIMKTVKLTALFTNFFGSSVRQAYVVSVEKDNDSLDLIKSYHRTAEESFDKVGIFMEMDFEFQVIVEFNDNSLVEIQFGTPDSPMGLSKVFYPDLTLVG